MVTHPLGGIAQNEDWLKKDYNMDRWPAETLRREQQALSTNRQLVLWMWIYAIVTGHSNFMC